MKTLIFNIIIYISAVKLSASKINVFIYIIYVYTMYIFYVYINTNTCMYIFEKNMLHLYIKYIYI